MKTLLPRSNAVITRHRGLSHPSLIKPSTGNTQVIRGLLFCISAVPRCCSKSKKNEKPRDCRCDGWGMESKNTSQNQCPVFWWTVNSAWQHTHTHTHAQICMCKPTHWKHPLIFCRVFSVLALTIEAKLENWTPLLRLKLL